MTVRKSLLVIIGIITSNKELEIFLFKNIIKALSNSMILSIKEFYAYWK